MEWVGMSWSKVWLLAGPFVLVVAPDCLVYAAGGPGLGQRMYGLDELHAELHVRPGYQDCIEASGGKSPRALTCSDAEMDYQDKRLNAVYRLLLLGMSEERRHGLRNEERAWLKARAKACAPPKALWDSAEIDIANCNVMETATRATALEASKAEIDPGSVIDGWIVGIRPTYSRCMNSNISTVTWLDCIYSELAFQNKRLNRVYKSLMDRLDQGEKVVLREDERNWLASKLARCALPDEPGTMHQVDSATCELSQTAARATNLEKRLGAALTAASGPSRSE